MIDMIFDFGLCKFADGVSCELSNEESRKVFEKYENREMFRGYYEVRLPDGSEVEVQPGLGQMYSPQFFPRSDSDSALRFIFECAQATGANICPEIIGNAWKTAFILVDPTQRAHLPPKIEANWPVVECGTVGEFIQVIHNEYERWNHHRKQFLGL